MEIQKIDYRPRLIDAKVKEALEKSGAICIEGPKWVGKTWTANFFAKSSFFVGGYARAFNNRTLAIEQPELALAGLTPHLIDEWQEVPQLWDAVRFAVDGRGKNGQFIITGSSVPKREGIMHSGAGRIMRLRMRPMSLLESGDSSGLISIKEMFEGIFPTKMTGEVSLKDLIWFSLRGGWPANIGKTNPQINILAKEYIEAVIKEDLLKLDGKKRNLDKVRLLLRSLARNESTTVSNSTIRKDIKEIDRDDIDIDTIVDYLDAFSKLYLIDNQEPFGKNLRSSERIKQSVKHHFCDPSIACALLDANSEKLLGDLQTFGFIFEALCERDLKIYAETLGGALYHYQDYAQKEIDAIIQMPDGKWGAFEIKLGTSGLDDAANSLLKIQKDFINDPHAIPPKFLCIISGLTNAAYMRKDGVYVVPITALGV